MLIKCPECSLQVSDIAITCPHCGYPIKSPERPAPRRKKRMRLPNGFGQISEIRGQNLRKPFRALVTTGKHENGRVICKPLKPVSYFATYNEAYAALVEYNRHPYDIESVITVNELYELWSREHAKTITPHRATTLDAAWRYCHDIYDIRAADLRPKHIEHCLNNGTALANGTVKHTTDSIRRNIKGVINQMYDFAVTKDLVVTNVARSYTYKSPTKAHNANKSHMSFTEAEMERLWNNVEDLSPVSLILIQCYSGWRPQELCLIRRENVDLKKWVFTGGMKTENGKNRQVPIHPRIRPLVKRWYQESELENNEFVFPAMNPQTKHFTESMTYSKYRYYFNLTIKQLGLNPEHSPHDCRLQFVTMAKRYKVDEYAIKYIVGHVISDITEKVYTDRDENWLHDEIAKIK